MFDDPLDKQFSQSLLDAARKINDKTTADAKTTKEEKERLEAEDDSLIGQFDESRALDQAVKDVAALGARQRADRKAADKNPLLYYKKKLVAAKAKPTKPEDTAESLTLAALGTIAGSVVAGAAVGTTLDALRKKLFRKKDPAVEYAKNVAKGKAEAEKTRLRSNRILAMRTGPRNSNR